MMPEEWLRYQHQQENDILEELLAEELENRTRRKGACASRAEAKRNLLVTVVMAVIAVVVSWLVPAEISVPVAVVAAFVFMSIFAREGQGCITWILIFVVGSFLYGISKTAGQWVKFILLVGLALGWYFSVWKQPKNAALERLKTAARRNSQKLLSQVVEDEMFTIGEEKVPGSRKPVLAAIMAASVLLGSVGVLAAFDDRMEKDNSQERVNMADEACYTWELTEAGYVLVDFDSGTRERNPVIPETYKGVPVVAIGERAMQNERRVTEVVIPDSVTEIGSYAFKGCTSLEMVSMNDQVVSIGGEAFYGCTALKSFTFPAGVTEVRGNLFQGCKGLKEVTLHEGITAIHAYAFNGCRSLRRITLPSGITEIRANTFEGCSALTGIVIPDGVTRIAAHAFRDCTALAEVDVPMSVQEIGSSAFRNCTALKEITIPKDCAVNERAFKESPTEVHRSAFSREQWEKIQNEIEAKESITLYFVCSREAGPEKVFYPGEEGQVVVADSDLFVDKISDAMELHAITELEAVHTYLEQMKQQGAQRVQYCIYSEIASEIRSEPWFAGVDYTIEEFLEILVEES